MLAALAAWCVAVLIASSSAAPAGSVRAQGPDVGTDAQRESGKTALPQVLLAVPRREGRRRRLRHAAPAPQAAELHDRQVQGPDDADRSAPDPSGPREHHQARHAVHLDARLADALRPGSVELAYFMKTFSADFANPENAPQPVPLPSAPNVTKESIELGKKLYEETGCVKCHGTLGRGDGPSAPTLEGRLGPSDTPSGPRAELDLPRRGVPRGYLPDDEHGVQRHADAGVRRRRPEARAEDGRSPTSSTLCRGAAAPGYSNLVVAKHVQDPIDLAKGAANFASAPAARFPIVGQIMEPGRSFHPPTTSVTVQADLRRRVDCRSSFDGTT